LKLQVRFTTLADAKAGGISFEVELFIFKEEDLLGE